MEAKPREDAFKLYFDNQKEIRRLTIRSANFSDVVKQLHDVYAVDNLYHPELRIQYVDDEGDKITVNSQSEWDEMFNTIGSQRPIKLYISDSQFKDRYFKDGPAPQPKYFYTAKNDSKDEEEQEDTSKPSIVKEKDEVLRTLELAVPKCLERLFPGGKILPYHLPDWLRDSGCIKVIPVPNRMEECDIDIDIFKLISVLNNQALKYISDSSPDSIETGKVFLYSVLDISPTNSMALYNLACAESLLGNVDAAVNALSKAVNEAGYSNVNHMEQDTDLDNIRHTCEYKKIVSQLKGVDSMKVDEPEPEPEPVKEEPKVEPVVEEKKVEPVSVVETKMEQDTDKVEEPVKEEPKVETNEKPMEIEDDNSKIIQSYIDNSKWPEPLKSLISMGFDAGLSSALLDESQGDITKVLMMLLPQ